MTLLNDLRDKRDPVALGERILQESAKSSAPITKVADWAELEEIPDYEGKLLGYYTAEQYRKELTQRDDRYAKSTLAAIESGTLHEIDPYTI